ncbi:hypothetical protein GCM10023155_15460 [Bremerella cremea]
MLMASLTIAQEKTEQRNTPPVRSRTTPVTSSISPNTLPPRQVAQGAESSDWKITAEERKRREEAALAFARKHHPALEKLLRQLRGMDQKEYGKAVRELYRVSERLGQMEERNPYLYDIQLQLWKASSSATLLAARLQLNPGDEDLRDELRKALEHKLATQKRVSEEELRRAEIRVERLKQNLQRLDQEGSALIERQMRQLDPNRKADRK